MSLYVLALSDVRVRVCVCVSAQGTALHLLALIDVNGKSEEGLARLTLLYQSRLTPINHEILAQMR